MPSDRTPRRRALDGIASRYPWIGVFSAASIILVTVVLLASTFGSWRSYRRAVDNLNLSKLELQLERVRSEAEAILWEHARAAFDRQILEEVTDLASSLDGPEELHRTRELLDVLRDRHPISRDWFIIRGEEVAFPRLRPDSSTARESAPPEGENVLAAGLADFLKRAREPGGTASALHSPSGLKAGVTSSGVVHRGAIPYPVFYRSLPAPAGEPLVVGFRVDLAWVQGHLFGQVRQGFPGIRELAPILTPAAVEPAADGRGDPSQEHDLISPVPFQTALPGWAFSVPESQVEETRGSLVQEMGFVVASGVALLCALGVAIVVMGRTVRELRLSRMRSHYISTLSHELKTPVTLIRLYSETLMNDPAPPGDERKGYFDIITHESERLGHLMDQLLSFSRTESNWRQYDLREGDIASVIAEVVNGYARHLKIRGFQVVAELAPEVPPVSFDSDAVSQAVLNLLDNARKYSGDAKFVGSRLFVNGNRVVFEVEDHGPGIPPAEREKIFNPFFRGRESPGKRGFGIGLYLVQHIMEAHGGRVEVDSEVGRGSVFRLVFPVSALRDEKPLKEAVGRSPA